MSAVRSAEGSKARTLLPFSSAAFAARRPRNCLWIFRLMQQK